MKTSLVSSRKFVCIFNCKSLVPFQRDSFLCETDEDKERAVLVVTVVALKTKSSQLALFEYHWPY
jgi:hypothetical protein